MANIKAAHPDIPIQYHSHAGPGFNMASILEVGEAGCDYIDAVSYTHLDVYKRQLAAFLQAANSVRRG